MASTRDSITDIWGPRTPHAGPNWPVRVDQNVEERPDRWVQSSCFLCSNGCGVDIGVKDDRSGGRIVGVRGREVDVVNRGRLGPKGLYGWTANASSDRLTGPLIRRGDRLEPANGRAFLRAVDYVPPTEEPDEMYPFFLTTGRVVYHFHTRTKTGRSKALRDAAPDAFIQLNEGDARRLGIREGEMLRVSSRRGVAEAPARIGGIESGTLFMPFHYGPKRCSSRTGRMRSDCCATCRTCG